MAIKLLHYIRSGARIIMPGVTILGLAGIPDDVRTWAGWLAVLGQYLDHQWLRTALVFVGIVLALLAWGALDTLWHRLLSSVQASSTPTMPRRDERGTGSTTERRRIGIDASGSIVNARGARIVNQDTGIRSKGSIIDAADAQISDGRGIEPTSDD